MPKSKGVVELQRTAKGELTAMLPERPEPVEDVRVVQCFPWTLPDQLIAIRDKDGHEIALLETLEDVSAETRAIIEDELKDNVFVPRIESVRHSESRFGIYTIIARTDRGEVTFQLRGADDVRFLTGSRILMKDVDGNLFEIPDVHALNVETRRHLRELFL